MITAKQWDEQLIDNQGHLLQSWAWGQLKSHFGWHPHRLAVKGGLAQVLFRQLPGRLTIAYLPKGPVVDWTHPGQDQALLAAVQTAARERRAIFLKVEPDLCASSAPAQDTVDFLKQAGFVPADTIQPRTSQVINIEQPLEKILGALKQKTRYNIRLAKRKGVVAREGGRQDVSIFHDLAQVTAERDGFGIHSLAYYQQAYQLFAPDRCALLIAEYEGEPLAGLMVFRQGQTAYYFYGASSNRHRNRMPAYLLQWAAIEWAKRQGCTHYDLWGIPDADPATLEAEFQHRRDGLWGVYRFKRGFGGQVAPSIGAFDYVYKPALYRLYRLWRRQRPT